MIAKFCSTADTSVDREVCSRILSFLNKDELEEFFLEAKVPLVNCVHIMSIEGEHKTLALDL